MAPNGHRIYQIIKEIVRQAIPSFNLKFRHRHARRARVIFCDLKAPGGCSTRWTHKGNSFMCTGVPDSSQCHYKV